MRFSRALVEYLEKGLTDFRQPFVILRQPYVKVFEIKRLKIGHSLLPCGNQFMRECWAKNHDLRKWHFLKISN